MNTTAILLFIALFACSRPETPVEPGVPDNPPEEQDTTVIHDQTDTSVVIVPQTVRYSDLIKELTSYDNLTRTPSVPYIQRQASSYDRRSVDPSKPEWYANDDGWGYERYEFAHGDTEKVIFDEQHPGVITRIWLTSFGSPKVYVRFYLDGDEEPTWEMDTYNLKYFGAEADMKLGDGLAQPSQEWIRGSSLYLPISYSKSCKITLVEQVDPTSTSRYYHINYRRYADDVDVETMTPDVLHQNDVAVRKANASLLAPVADSGSETTAQVTLAPGESYTFDLPGGTRSLNSLGIKAATDQLIHLADAMHGLVVEGAFDGYNFFAVPMVYLTCQGIGAPSNRSWRFDCNATGTYNIRWKMPYKSSGCLIFHNTSGLEISLDLKAVVGNYNWTDSSLYFHAANKRSEDVPIRYWSDYVNGYEWDFADISGGRGLYVGDMYSIYNYTSNWPGEGDEKIFVDGEELPSHFGTGVEDYYSFCGYFRFNTPFSGEPRLDNSNFSGWNTHYRTRILDAIPFSESLRFKLEMEGHEAGKADLENAIFWYGDENTKASGITEYNFD